MRAGVATVPTAEARHPAAAGTAVQQTRDYLTARWAQAQYPQLRAPGRPIGRGCVASGHTRVMPARLKGPGMHGAADHGHPLLARRCALLNGRWAERWPPRMQHWRMAARAARRQQQRQRQRRAPRPAGSAPCRPSVPGGRGAARAVTSPGPPPPCPRPAAVPRPSSTATPLRPIPGTAPPGCPAPAPPLPHNLRGHPQREGVTGLCRRMTDYAARVKGRPEAARARSVSMARAPRADQR